MPAALFVLHACDAYNACMQTEWTPVPAPRDQRLAQWTPVRIRLGARGTDIREGVVLVDSGETLIVEYRTGLSGAERGCDYRSKSVKRDRVEVL